MPRRMEAVEQFVPPAAALKKYRAVVSASPLLAFFAYSGQEVPVPLCCGTQGGQMHNQAVNTDAQVRPLPSVAPSLVRRLLLR